MEDTWTNRDLPVLEAAVRLLDADGHWVSVRDIANATGIEPEDVARSLIALNPRYVGEMGLFEVSQDGVTDR